MPPYPTPTTVLAARGSWTAKDRQGEPTLPSALAVECPEQLVGYGRQEWGRVAPALLAAGVVTVGDFAALVEYCDAFHDLMHLIELANHLDIETRLTKRIFTAKQRAGARLLTAAGHLGLSPASRTKIRVLKPTDPLALPPAEDGDDEILDSPGL